MRILVAFASRYGGTLGIAEAIARSLEDAGHEVDVVPADEARDLGRYDAFVLGSGVYVGRWLKPARKLVEKHATVLAARPTWLFSSGPIGAPPKPEAETAVDADDIVALTDARGHRVFAGKLDKSRLRFGDRAVVTAVRSPEGDFRDWEEIDAWAREIATALSPVAAATAL
jgi:menaquinone-dependent protoporphyrinogen oxidase